MVVSVRGGESDDYIRKCFDGQAIVVEHGLGFLNCRLAAGMPFYAGMKWTVKGSCLHL